MKAVVSIPADAPFLQGHFPGRPIVPGVALLMLAAGQTTRHTGYPICGISYARFRQLVGPGDELTITGAQRVEGKARFELSRGSACVANGEFLLGPLAQATGAEAVMDCSRAAAPDLDLLLPQRPPMRLVTGVVAEREDGLACTACMPSTGGLASAGDAPAVAGLEAAAQTAALWEALRRSRQDDGNGARVGYVVSVRDVVYFADAIPAERDFIAEVRLEQAALPMTEYAVQVSIDGVLLLQGRLATFLTGETLLPAAR